MNCNEFHQSVTLAVDRRLDPAQMASFLRHAEECSPCRLRYEGERDVVELVHRRVHRVGVPPAVVSRILSRIASEELVLSAGSRDRHFLWFPAWLVRPILMFGVSFVAVVLIVTRTGPITTAIPAVQQATNDIISQSISAYHSVLKGTLAPEVSSDHPDQVRKYFEGKTEFPVIVPVMKECTLIGGALNEVHGTRLAHLQYKHGPQTISISQACRETVTKGEKLVMPKEVHDELLRTGWYRTTAPDGASIVVWVNGNTICAAVAPMQGEHLMAYLVEAGSAGGW
ncbi:MAG: anti-sigma factor [Bacteroidota bacterium]